MKDDHILAVFKQEGYSSVIAVPITNYRTLGIMGAAYRKRNKLSKSYSELFATLANILGMTLYRHIVINHRTQPENRWQRDTETVKSIESAEGIEENISLISNKVINKISSLIHSKFFP